MPKVRLNADKWKRRAAAAATDYQSGVQNPRTPWHQAVQAAQQSYEQGVTQAIADNRYGKAATPANTVKQQQKAATLGAQRYGPGVQASGDAYQQGMKPYVAVMENTVLPPRGPKGDPANYQRAIVMGTALNDAKKQIKGS